MAVDERQPTVLVVDDDPRSLKLMTIVLGRAGYRVVTANDGSIGLERLSIEPPDVVLVDLLMPGMNGLEFCRQVREVRGAGALPLVLLTTKASDEIRQQAQQAGADLVLVKPFDRLDLLERVVGLLRRSGDTSAQDRDVSSGMSE